MSKLPVTLLAKEKREELEQLEHLSDVQLRILELMALESFLRANQDLPAPQVMAKVESDVEIAKVRMMISNIRSKMGMDGGDRRPKEE